MTYDDCEKLSLIINHLATIALRALEFAPAPSILSAMRKTLNFDSASDCLDFVALVGGSFLLAVLAAILNYA
jgi:hypothetical protein